jgi:hypothetical protein
MSTLQSLGIVVAIYPKPVEVPDPIPFVEDNLYRAYDADAAYRFWRIVTSCDSVFKQFRARFLGKSSPVHFFWGSFDLAVTRFSGRRAPERPGADSITREAYSHEVSSAGFWPGSGAFPHAAFYSYAYPERATYSDRPVTAGARFDRVLGEFILPYDAVRAVAKPDALLLDFLSTTYAAAADAGNWDRSTLECALGAPAQVRPV